MRSTKVYSIAKKCSDKSHNHARFEQTNNVYRQCYTCGRYWYEAKEDEIPKQESVDSIES